MATECHPPSSVNLWACTVSIFLCNRLHWLFSCSKSQVKFGKEATVPSLTYTGTKSQDSPDQGSRQSQGTQFNDKCTVTGASMALAVQRCLPEDSDGMLATWLLLKRLHHLLCADCRGRSGRGVNAPWFKHHTVGCATDAAASVGVNHPYFSFVSKRKQAPKKIQSSRLGIL